MKYFLCILFLITFKNPAFAQKTETQLGIKILNEYNEKLEFALGIQSVFRIKKHGGLETGLYYKPRRVTVVASLVPDFYIVNISDRSLQLPFWYRFDSKQINFVCGPSFEYFIGWRNKTKNSNITVNDYNRDPKTRLAISCGISKTININSWLILEPELRANFFTDSEQPDLGLNISFRHSFSKSKR